MEICSVLGCPPSPTFLSSVVGKWVGHARRIGSGHRGKLYLKQNVENSMPRDAVENSSYLSDKHHGRPNAASLRLRCLLGEAID